MRILENIQEYINTNNYNDLLVFLFEQREFEYSFIPYITYMINTTNNEQLDIIKYRYLNFNLIDGA